MTPRANNTDPLDPLEEIRFDIKRVLLHVAGGIGPDGQAIKGQGEQLREQNARLLVVEEFIASAKRLAVGVVATVAAAVAGAWALLGFGPPHSPGH